MCIYFNRQCLIKKLTPSYARIKIPKSSPAHKHTRQKVTTLRIKDEIKHLHCKKKKTEIKLNDLPVTHAIGKHMGRSMAAFTIRNWRENPERTQTEIPNLIFVVPSIVIYSNEISPTRCNNCVFILRIGFTLHVSGDNLTHHQEYICCIWPQVSRLT